MGRRLRSRTGRRGTRSLVDAVEEIAARLDALGQWERRPALDRHWLIAQNNAALGHEPINHRRDRLRERNALPLITAADIRVAEGSVTPNAAERQGQCVAEFAKHEKLAAWNAERMRGKLSVKGENSPARQKHSEMVVGSSIAKTQLDNRPIDRGDKLGSPIETAPLGLETPDETVETAHARQRFSAA